MPFVAARERSSAVPIHLCARSEEVAPVALVVGDPGRAQRIAAALTDARCYNENRGLLGFTGFYQGARLSVQTTGMGAPAAAIVVEELADLGVRTVIRLGTCGAIAERVQVLDLVIASGAVPRDGTSREYSGGEPFAPVADFAVLRALVDAGQSVARPTHVGLLVTEDAFYREERNWSRWRDRGVLAVEMETAAIFTVALHRGLRAGALCLAVDRVGERSSWASDEAIHAAGADLITLGLEAAAGLARA